jgi:glutathione S-transferase
MRAGDINRPSSYAYRQAQPPNTKAPSIMKLYNSNFSPNALRVRAVAAELGIDLEIIEVDFRKGEHKAASYLELNPNGKVPVLVDGDFVLWESRAINGYLASLKPEHGLYPDDAKRRALIDQWSHWQAIHLGPAMQKVAFERVMKSKFGMGEPDENTIASGLKEIDQFLPILDANLKGKEWGGRKTQHRRLRGRKHVRLSRPRRHLARQSPARLSLDRPPRGAPVVENSRRPAAGDDAGVMRGRDRESVDFECRSSRYQPKSALVSAAILIVAKVEKVSDTA